MRSLALWRCLFLAAYANGYANGLQQRLVGLFLCTCPQRRGIGKYTDVEAPFAALSIILLALTPLPALDWTLDCHTIDLTLFKLILYLGADSRSLDKSPRYTKAMNKSGCMLDTPNANLYQQQQQQRSCSLTLVDSDHSRKQVDSAQAA